MNTAIPEPLSACGSDRRPPVWDAFRATSYLCEIEVTHKTIHRHIERFAGALDAPSLDLVGPVEIDEVYVSAGKKGRERDQ